MLPSIYQSSAGSDSKRRAAARPRWRQVVRPGEGEGEGAALSVTLDVACLSSLFVSFSIKQLQKAPRSSGNK